MERISNHPALIGIEVINQFLSNENEVLSNTGGVQFDRCDPPYLNSPNSIAPQMSFLGFNAEIVKQYSSTKLIGVSIDAICGDCLHLTLIQTCRQIIQGFTHDGGFDFITIVSDSLLANQEPYHYSRWNSDNFEWFHQVDIHTAENVKESKFRGVFFVLHGSVEDVINLNKTINSIASGYFISDDIVRSGDLIVSDL